VNSVLDLFTELAAYAGRPAGPARTAPTAVSETAIYNWCAALGDALPVYTDAAFASEGRWGGIIAPPTMLQTWTMPDRRTTPPSEPGPGEAEAELIDVLRQHGYHGVVATNSDQSYARPVRLGDTITSQATIVGVTGPKRTAIGEGYFVTTQTAYADAGGEPVGTLMFRAFRYRPEKRHTATPLAPPQLPSSPTVILGRSTGARTIQTRSRSAVFAGVALPVLEIPITPTLVVAGSIASGDFNVLHHDRDRARAAGAADIFLNILATNGLVGRYVGEWAGPDARISRIGLRLGVPNYPYDALRLSGVVAQIGDIVELQIRGTNSLGECISATAEVELP
jgi:acyl dehydratase